MCTCHNMTVSMIYRTVMHSPHISYELVLRNFWLNCFVSIWTSETRSFKLPKLSETYELMCTLINYEICSSHKHLSFKLAHLKYAVITLAIPVKLAFLYPRSIQQIFIKTFPIMISYVLICLTKKSFGSNFC